MGSTIPRLHIRWQTIFMLSIMPGMMLGIVKS